MKITNNQKLPQAIVDAVSVNEYSKGDCDISVTELIGPPQQRLLKMANKDRLEEDAADRIYALMGIAVHHILEKSGKGFNKKQTKIFKWVFRWKFMNYILAKLGFGLNEHRLQANYNDWLVSGQFDRLGYDGTLQDYKLASVWEFIHGIKPERIQQLNVYAQLCRDNGYKVDDLQVVFIFRDWQKSKAKFDNGYPQKQAAVIGVPLWSEEKTKKFISDRINAHTIDALCTDDERWHQGDTWAVKKKNRKKALRVLGTEDEAKEWQSNYGGDLIEYRQGVNRRCEDYCVVAPFCEQWKSLSET